MVVPAFFRASKFARHAFERPQRIASTGSIRYIRFPVTNTATERVGRYQLLEPIGLGPTGTVSRAKVFGVAGFERQFAIKRFHGDLTAAMQIAAALSAAARAYGGLEHPRIARMSEFGIAQGTTYTAVEFVSGLDALRLITEVRMSNTTLAAGGALALVSQAARAVGYAHGRGLTHLGLSPTNVIVTPEGDVKITDFGMLAATLGPRPVEVPRMVKRIAYLAPEQIANEATSAATDVFALGVLAYELITGERAFEGDTAAEIARAVTTRPPPEPSLPRPITRVIQRCLARSPFERFPDARALADALDAALRVAPVPGTRKDIGATVKQIVDRLADLHSGELSGMLTLDLGTANIGAAAPVVALGGAPRESVDLATMEFVRPDTPVAGPAPLVGPAARPTRKPNELDEEAEALPPVRSTGMIPPISRQLKGVPQTVPGLAPPPIPATATPPPLPPMPMPGVPKSIKPLVGAVPPPRPQTKSTSVPVIGPLDRPSESPVSPLKMMATAPSGAAPIVQIAPMEKQSLFGPRPETEDGDLLEHEFVEATTLLRPEPEPSLSVEMEIVHLEEPEPAAGPVDRPTSEMSPLLRDQLALEASRKSQQLSPWRPMTLDEISAPNEMPTPPSEGPAMRISAVESGPIERKTLAGFQPSRSLPAQPASISQPIAPPSVGAGFSQRHLPTMDVGTVSAKRSKTPILIASVLGVLAAGAGAYVLYDVLSSESSGETRVEITDAATPDTASPDAAVAVVVDATKIEDATVAVVVDAKPVADAAVVATVDAAMADAAVKVDPGNSAALTIASTPAGARVYFDGADSGVTPLKLPGTPDKHTVAVFSAGHELYIAQVNGSGAYTIPLKEVTPSGGPAGIKVTKCAKDRYYVFVDGKPTGMVCPTERIEVDLGAHTIEVYDMITEARRQFPVVVKDTRLSARVRIE